MPIALPNGSRYKLVLLDTNALSEMAKRPAEEGVGYFKRFPPSDYVPCFTIYNVVELRRNRSVLAAFYRLFESVPTMITKPFPELLAAEVRERGRIQSIDAMMAAFSQQNPNDAIRWRRIIDGTFHDESVDRAVSAWRTDEEATLGHWEATRANFSPSGSDGNARDADRFVQEASLQTLAQLHPEFVRSCAETRSLEEQISLPSMQAMLYSQYYRMYGKNRKSTPSDVTDVAISAVAPYVDVIVTETFQAGVYRKVAGRIDGMEVEIATLRDVRPDGSGSA